VHRNDATGAFVVSIIIIIGPILWGHSGPLCHALSLLLLSMLSLWTSILHCHLQGVATVARRLCYSYSWLRLILVVVSTVATPGEWQCKIRTGGVRRLAVANGPNIFQMLLVIIILLLFRPPVVDLGAMSSQELPVGSSPNF